MEELYFTIAGCSHYFGSDFMEKGMKVKLEKEPDNEYDKEAIQVKIKGLGKVRYVANSPFTVKGESMSAGRLYDKIEDKAKGKVVFVVDGGGVCRITDIEMNKQLKEMDMMNTMWVFMQVKQMTVL